MIEASIHLEIFCVIEALTDRCPRQKTQTTAVTDSLWWGPAGRVTDWTIRKQELTLLADQLYSGRVPAARQPDEPKREECRCRDIITIICPGGDCQKVITEIEHNSLL